MKTFFPQCCVGLSHTISIYALMFVRGQNWKMFKRSTNLFKELHRYIYLHPFLLQVKYKYVILSFFAGLIKLYQQSTLLD